MLDYTILSQKPTITVVKDNVSNTYKDLLTQTFTGVNIEGGKVVMVEKDYVARPDLISLAVYGDDRYADFICKVNGVSNPFELNEDMILYIPDMNNIQKAITGTKFTSDVLDEFKTTSSNKINNIIGTVSSGTGTSYNNKETIERKKKNLQKYKNERRTPGEQTVTDNNYVIDKTLGLVIY